MKKSLTSLLVLSFIIALLSLYIGDLRLPYYYMFPILWTVALIYLAAYLGIFKYVAGFIVMTLISLAAVYRFYFGERISIGVIESILATNTDEVASMSGQVWPVVALALPLTVVLIALFIFVVKTRRAGILLSLLTVFFATNVFALSYWRYADIEFFENIKSYPPYLNDRYASIDNILISPLVTVGANYAAKRIYTEDRDRSLPPYVEKVAEGVDVFVFVIGEASFPERYTIYGYDELTTPGLARLMDVDDDEESTCTIDDVHSGSPVTRDSVAMLISFALPENVRPLFDEKSLIDLAADNDYRTHWVTATQIDGLWDQRYGFIAGRSENIENAEWDDNNLVRIFKKLMVENDNSKLFIVLHMRGSHMSYSQPMASDDFDRKQLPDADAYDLTIHKTDRVLSGVVDILKNSGRRYAFLFTSDHGEIVDKGHSLLDGGVDQFLVPYIYMTNDLRYDMCDFIDQDLRNDNGYVNLINNKFVTAQILGYDVSASYIKQQVSDDRVLHVNGKVYQWSDVLEQ